MGSYCEGKLGAGPHKGTTADLLMSDRETLTFLEELILEVRARFTIKYT